MCKFVKIIIDKNQKIFKNIEYMPQVIELFRKFSRYLFDDFFSEQNDIDLIIDLVEKTSPYFWIILDKKNREFAGFVFLENFVGNAEMLYSAEITTCFKPKYWGFFTKKCAKKFLKYCFKNYGLKKIKALIFEQNFKVKAILKYSGFKKEGQLKAETLKNGMPQNIDVYSIIKRRV
jgi:RimJ/RimL family protein N-acetyltransferase